MPSNVSIYNNGAGPQNVQSVGGTQSNNNGSGTQNNYYAGKDNVVRGTRTRNLGNAANHSSRENFKIAIICALPLGYDAITMLFNQPWVDYAEKYGRAPGDKNTYTTGRIGDHDVVLVLLPKMGKASAAMAATRLMSSFPRLKLAFLVGICGGVPRIGKNEARLGDVIISKTVVQYDFGRQYTSEFVIKKTVDDLLGRGDDGVRSLISIYETEHGRRQLRKMSGQYVGDLLETAKRMGYQTDYGYPGIAEDKLFKPEYEHQHRLPSSCDICQKETENYCDEAAGASCNDLHCSDEHLVHRELRPSHSPEIFVGRIASGDRVMKSGQHRDQLAKEQDVIAFEMEGAGICDYADSHKNKKCQPFAALAAAAVTKVVLGRYYALTDASAVP
ncbi:purine and uridine phosphorylase [Nemania sp. FL0031]|nr:purine and uridine phosphorylase [Nemania sp. FL0031]